MWTRELNSCTGELVNLWVHELVNSCTGEVVIFDSGTKFTYDFKKNPVFLGFWWPKSIRTGFVESVLQQGTKNVINISVFH